LAQRYDEFLHQFGLEDLGLDAELSAISSGFREDETMRWFRGRDACMHDIRHLRTGYGPDRRGEMCLLAFRYAQMRHPGLLTFIVLALIGELVRLQPVVAAIREAYRRGRTTRFLDLIDWEAAPERPLEAYQQSLGLAPPRHYRWPQSIAG
jgi:ubiquinone biosynthesis protein COQ4